MVILFRQLYMYNWPRRIIHILYGWSLITNRPPVRDSRAGAPLGSVM